MKANRVSKNVRLKNWKKQHTGRNLFIFQNFDNTWTRNTYVKVVQPRRILHQIPSSVFSRGKYTSKEKIATMQFGLRLRENGRILKLYPQKCLLQNAKVINKVAYFSFFSLLFFPPRTKHSDRFPHSCIRFSHCFVLYLLTTSPSSIRQQSQICGCGQDGFGQHPSNFQRLSPVDRRSCCTLQYAWSCLECLVRNT